MLVWICHTCNSYGWPWSARIKVPVHKGLPPIKERKKMRPLYYNPWLKPLASITILSIPVMLWLTLGFIAGRIPMPHSISPPYDYWVAWALVILATMLGIYRTQSWREDLYLEIKYPEYKGFCIALACHLSLIAVAVIAYRLTQ
jgi:hypothetical protein